MTKTESDLLARARVTLVFAFDSLYAQRRSNPRVNQVLDRIQARIDEITAHFGDAHRWAFGAKDPPPFLENPGAHEPQ